VLARVFLFLDGIKPNFKRLSSMTNIIKKLNPIREAILESHDNTLQDLAAELTDEQLERLQQLMKLEWNEVLKS
jgi:hypothetical protein